MSSELLASIFHLLRLVDHIPKKWRSLVIIGLIALIFILGVPLLLNGFRLNLLGRFLALAIVSLGIDLIWGFTGMLSLGHGVFFALGGYAIAMYLKLQIPADVTVKVPDFMSQYGINELPWFWVPFGNLGFSFFAIFILPTVLGGFLGYLVFRNRIKGVYFSILTQAATIVFYNFFNGQQKLFNGTNGLNNFDNLFGLKLQDNKTQYILYVLTIGTLIGAYFLCRWLTQGRFGKLLIAIRDDENRLRFSGYDPTQFKVLVFAISAGLAGIAGALYTLQTGLISPASMNIEFSIEMVIWVAVGGRGTLIGAILGTLFVNFAKSLLSEQFPDFWLFLQGALFLLVVTAVPDGIVGFTNSPLWIQIKELIGIREPLLTYPSLETDPDIQHEREDFRN